MRLDALLQASGGTLPVHEQRALAAHVLDRSTAWVFAHGDHALDAPSRAMLSELLSRRSNGEPLAYLTGRREFYGRDFRVSPAVLIPRPETEHLVEAVLETLTSDHAHLVDVGTGSGCIALTLAAERPGWRVTGTDISEDALAMAEANRARLGVSHVDWHCGNLLADVTGTFDAIVSNPPYVAAGDPHLEQGDLRFEPTGALTDDGDGLGLIRRLVLESTSRLQPAGWLWMEHGYDQASRVRDLLAQAGFERIQSRKDLAGIERISGGRWPA